MSTPFDITYCTRDPNMDSEFPWLSVSEADAFRGRNMTINRVPGILANMRRWLELTTSRPYEQYLLDREAVRELVAELVSAPEPKAEPVAYLKQWSGMGEQKCVRVDLSEYCDEN